MSLEYTPIATGFFAVTTAATLLSTDGTGKGSLTASAVMFVLGLLSWAWVCAAMSANKESRFCPRHGGRYLLRRGTNRCPVGRKRGVECVRSVVIPWRDRTPNSAWIEAGGTIAERRRKRALFAPLLKAA